MPQLISAARLHFHIFQKTDVAEVHLPKSSEIKKMHNNGNGDGREGKKKPGINETHQGSKIGFMLRAMA
jgi:hypothetical protein